MRAAKMTERPSFQLMVQTDVQSIYHMQMPRWLFSDPRYCEMSLDAKVTYTFLLNRFQLSRRNGWVNERGEVFVIFPRKALAKELRICEQRVTAAFKKLVALRTRRRQSDLSCLCDAAGRSCLRQRALYRAGGELRFKNCRSCAS